MLVIHLIGSPMYEDAITRADVVIGALRSGDGRTPCVVSDEMVSMMKEGSVSVPNLSDEGLYDFFKSYDDYERVSPKHANILAGFEVIGHLIDKKDELLMPIVSKLKKISPNIKSIINVLENSIFQFITFIIA